MKKNDPTESEARERDALKIPTDLSHDGVVESGKSCPVVLLDRDKEDME